MVVQNNVTHQLHELERPDELRAFLWVRLNFPHFFRRQVERLVEYFVADLRRLPVIARIAPVP